MSRTEDMDASTMLKYVIALCVGVVLGGAWAYASFEMSRGQCLTVDGGLPVSADLTADGSLPVSADLRPAPSSYR